MRTDRAPGVGGFGPRPRGPRPGGSRRARRALTMIETAICTLIVAMLLTAALHTAGAAKVSHTRAADLVQAQTLAHGLLAEVIQKPFLDPSIVDVTNPGPLGVETGESLTNKTTFNDVDDYYRWTEEPPQDALGAALAGRAAWRREVSVQWVEPADLTTVSTTATKAKRVTVTALRGGRRLATVSAVRTNAP